MLRKKGMCVGCVCGGGGMHACVCVCMGVCVRACVHVYVCESEGEECYVPDGEAFIPVSMKSVLVQQ